MFYMRHDIPRDSQFDPLRKSNNDSGGKILCSKNIILYNDLYDNTFLSSVYLVFLLMVHLIQFLELLEFPC